MDPLVTVASLREGVLLGAPAHPPPGVRDAVDEFAAARGLRVYSTTQDLCSGRCPNWCVRRWTRAAVARRGVSVNRATIATPQVLAEVLGLLKGHIGAGSCCAQCQRELSFRCFQWPRAPTHAHTHTHAHYRGPLGAKLSSLSSLWWAAVTPCSTGNTVSGAVPAHPIHTLQGTVGGREPKRGETRSDAALAASRGQAHM